MAKQPKKEGFSIKGFDAQAYKQTEAYVQAIDALYNQAIMEFAQLAIQAKINQDKPFAFKDYPATQAKVQQIVNALAAKMQAVITKGSREQWLYACRKNDEFIASILNTSKISKAKLDKMQDRNLEALKTFQGRKVNGMDLSQRVWRYTGQLKTTMELGIDVAIGKGASAAALSRELRKYLKEPDNLFRKVKDKHGNLVLSKAAKALHPGQGVYRSSYKNAMRLTRSEINLAYKEADQLRWQQLDFVVGYEIKLSNNHTLNGEPFVDICDKLAGRYPKSFRFKGWHPQCRCLVVPILQTREEFNDDELADLKSALNGKEYQKYASKNTVTDVPDSFKEWIQENAERSRNWASQPYFVKDNFKGGTIDGGLKFDTAPMQIVKPEIKAPVEDLISKALNITKGKEMSFDDANGQKGNIDFGKSMAYSVNCQSCVVANELRRRGYDVTAQANLQKAGNVPYELSRKTEMAWIDPGTGKHPVVQSAGGPLQFDRRLRLKPKSINIIAKDLNTFTSEVGRYHISFVWKGTRSGHIITIERLSNGKVSLYDPQNGKLITWKDLSSRISPSHGIQVYRVDNLEVNVDIISGVVRKL